MPKLVIQKDQLGATGHRVVSFDAGITPTQMLMQEIPEGVNPDSSQVFVNSIAMELPSEECDGSDLLFLPLHKDSIVTVINEVKGLDPFSITIAAIWGASAAVAALIPYPDTPGGQGQVKDSPNNTLQSQTNIARPYQAYPLIFGSPVPYPDLTAQALIEYDDNIKSVRQLMNIGIGKFDIEEVRTGSTPLLAFFGASYTIYEPVNDVVTVPEVVIPFYSNEVDGQELLGTNQGADGQTFNLVDNLDETSDAGVNILALGVLKDVQSDLLYSTFNATPGDFNVSTNYKRAQGGLYVDSSGSGRINNIDILTGVGGEDYYRVVILEFTGPPDDGSLTPEIKGPYDMVQKGGETLGPFKFAEKSQQIWSNVIFNRGLKGTVDIRMEAQKLDGPNGSPTGPIIIDDWSYTEDTFEQKFFTRKLDLVDYDYYQFTLRRTNNALEDAESPDQATIESVAGVTIFNNLEFGNNTLLDVTMPATVNATSLRENEVNLTATRMVISYDGTSVDYTLRPSRKMADALLHLYLIEYGLDEDTIAIDELYEIQSELDAINPNLATFDYTFDDIDLSLDEQMNAILNVARVYKWNDGGVYRFVRDEAREFESTIITRRDIINEGEREYQITYSPQLLSKYDSVKVEYVDKAINKKAYVYRSIDSGGLVVDVAGANPLEIELAGCSEVDNAINRAELEIRKLIYQRWTLTDTLTSSGMLVDRGDLVIYANQYEQDKDVFDGEILNIAGDIATVSESLSFVDGSNYQIHYTLPTGVSAGPFDITPIAGEKFKFQCGELSQAYTTDSTLGFLIQTGSRFFISTSDDIVDSKWTMMEKYVTSNTVNVTMVNYDERIYEFDS